MIVYIIYTSVLVLIYKLGSFIISITGFTTCIEDVLHINAAKVLFVATIVFIILPLYNLLFKKARGLRLFSLIYAVIILNIILLEGSLSIRFAAFNDTLWKTFPNQRRIMYHDLKETKILNGASGQQIKNILGMPDDEIDLYGNNSKIMVYFTNKSKMYIYVYINRDRFQKLEIIN